MKTHHLLSFLLFFLVACGGGNDLASKKQLLKDKQMALEKLKAEITILEKEITQADPNFKNNQTTGVLVTTTNVNRGTFNSYVEVQGNVETDNNVILNAETSGIVRQLLVSEGQYVGAGQLLAVQDSEILQRSISEVKTGLELAEITFKRQENLWNQKIGTELQYLQAKNNKESFEKKLQTLQAQVGLSNIVAPFAGVVDEIYIKRGQAAMPGSQILRLVSSGIVNVVAEVSETYLTKIKQGDMVNIAFPSLKIEKQAPVSLIGATINPENRTFRVEVKIANTDGLLKPDLLATLKLKNDEKAESITIPTNLIQRDKAGDFIFIVADKDKKKIAKMVRIKRGETANNQTLILEGLKGDEILIDEGFKDVVDGLEIEIVKEIKGKVAEG